MKALVSPARGRRSALVPTLAVLAVTLAAEFVPDGAVVFPRSLTRVAAPAPGIIDSLLGSEDVNDLATTVPQMPYGLAAWGGSVVVADPTNYRVLSMEPPPASGPGPYETVMAGNGGFGSGPDVDPLSSQLAGPYGLASDSSQSHLYIADTYAHVIRVVDETGDSPSITLLAGSSGQMGWQDGGLGKARFTSPYGIALDEVSSQASLYIADTDNNVIRRIVDPASKTMPPSPSTGRVITVAGSGAAGFNGDGPAVTATLYRPRGLAVGQRGELYIADTYNNRIRVFDPPTASLRTIAGTGTAGFNGDGPAASRELDHPTGLAYDSRTHSLLIADTANDLIRRLDLGKSTITTVAGMPRQPGYDGDCPVICPPATSTRLNAPFAVTVSDGRIFIADTLNYRVRLLSAGGLWAVAGNGHKSWGGDNLTPSGAQLSGVSSMGYLEDDPNCECVERHVFFADPFNHAVRDDNLDTQVVSTIAGEGRPGYSGDGDPDARKALLDEPFGIAVSPAVQDGGRLVTRIYVADTFNNRIRVIRYPLSTSDVPTITTLAGTGTCGFSGDNGPATRAALCFPTGVALDGAGNLYIADAYNARIRKISAEPSPDGTRHISTVAGSGRLGYRAVDEGQAGPSARLFFPYGVTVENVTTGTTSSGSSSFSSIGSDWSFSDSTSLSSTSPPPTPDVEIADSFDNRILRLAADGSEVTTVAGDGVEGFAGDGGDPVHGQLDRPWGTAFDSAGNLYIADELNNRVRMVVPDTSGALGSGRLSTYAAAGPSGELGDGGAATVALMSGPRGLAIGFQGALLAADAFGNRIRRIGTGSLHGTPLTDFGDAVVNCSAIGTKNSCQTSQWTALFNTGSQVISTDIRVSDAGTGDIHGSSVDFTVDASACPPELEPGAECSVQVSFVPMHVGPSGASLVSQADPSFSVAVSGTGLGVLAFTQQPSSGSACVNDVNYPDTVWPDQCQPRVGIFDAQGQRLSAPGQVDAAQGVSLTMLPHVVVGSGSVDALVCDQTSSTSMFDRTTTTTALGGAASFSGCVGAIPGDYTLHASGNALVAADSDSFTIYAIVN